MTNAILRGKPDAGNPHVRFDEGEVASAKPRRGSLLYNKTAAFLSVVACTLVGQAAPLPVCFTFDDGPAGNISEVAPALEKRGWHGIFNIVTDKVGTPRHMTWDDVRELKRRGHDIASHSLSHPNLRQLLEQGRTNEVRRQIFGSRDVLKRELGEAPGFFCHPFVAISPAVDALIVEAGMKPMTGCRHLMTSKSKPGGAHGAAKKIENELAKGAKARPMDILFHGTSPTSFGWEAMTGADDFEGLLDEVAELEKAGRIRVVDYAEYHRAFVGSAPSGK